MDMVAMIGFGGLWVALFTWQLGKRSLIPINDPQFESTMEQMHAGHWMKDKHKGNGHRTETPDVSHIRNVEVTHETSDINVRAVLTFAARAYDSDDRRRVWSRGCCLLTSTRRKRNSRGPGRWRCSKEERLPPEPRLQAAPGFAITTGRRADAEAWNWPRRKRSIECCGNNGRRTSRRG